MKKETSTERVWPYVLPFPLDPAKRALIWAILQSRVGLRILENLSVDKRTYQHDLIQDLPYSNKSIIKYLKKMVKAEVLEQGMETSREKGRAVWIKWYKPTRFGKWLILFLKTPSEVSSDLKKTVIEELFRLYSSSIVGVCQRYGMNIDSFHQILNKQHLLEIVREQLENKPEVTVFGSVALDIYGVLKRLPSSDELVYVEETGRYPGGMGANVAVALAKLGVPVTFFGRIGNDFAGSMLLENLSKSNVDVSNVQLVDAHSVQTLILSDKEKRRWLFAIGSPQAAISLRLPEEVNWKIIKDCKVVYIGEVFSEIASAIGQYARARGKTVIYRPGAPFMEFGIKNLHRTLDYTTIFILNQTSWKQLQSSSRQSLENPAGLLKYGPRNVILTKGAEGCEIFSIDRHQEFSVSSQLKTEFKPVDPTGAGDAFSAGLIKGLLSNWSLDKAAGYGQVVASIACSRVGASPSFPAEEEAKAAWDLLLHQHDP